MRLNSWESLGKYIVYAGLAGKGYKGAELEKLYRKAERKFNRHQALAALNSNGGR